MEGQLSPNHVKYQSAVCAVNQEDGKEDDKCNKYEDKTSLAVSLPEYPKYGVIGSAEPVVYINHFYKPKSRTPKLEDFKRQKFDFHEMYEKCISSNTMTGITQYATPLPGLGNLYRGLKTADLYTIDPRLPLRFREPDLLQGYGCERPENPLFRTTSSEYGKHAPSVHDVPVEYHGLKNTFTSHLASTGMPRNRSLNIK